MPGGKSAVYLKCSDALAFQSFLQGSQDKTPADLGYMSVVSPIPQGRMEMPWWGLTFQLTGRTAYS